MRSIFYLFIGIFMMSILFSCSGGDSTSEDKKSKKEEIIEEKPVVCIYDGIAIREEPDKQGKYITSVSLGESFTYLGKTKVDSTDNNREYYFVELSDGTQGWGNAWGLIIDAKIAATIMEAPVYNRPDLLNKTDKVIEVIDIVAVTEEKEDWVNVYGNKRQISGWIKKENLTFNEEDIVTASLVRKELYTNKGNFEMEKLEDFIANAPFKGNRFIQQLQEVLDETQASEIIEDEIEGIVNEESMEDTVASEM